MNQLFKTLKIKIMKKSLFILTVILSTMMLSCKPQAETGGADNNYSDTEINGHEYVDLGLPSGLKWATCNVGASSPEEYGDYYAWGETETKYEYSWDNYSSNAMSDIAGKSSYDVACKKWSYTWRMPKHEEMVELVEKCTWEWVQIKGVNGCKITGPNGNHIFLPASGNIKFDNGISGQGEWGSYWTSTPCNDKYAEMLSFNSYDFDDMVGGMSRCYGYSVRPVTE